MGFLVIYRKLRLGDRAEPRLSEMEMDRKAYKSLSLLEKVELSKMGGSLATPTAPQMTDVNPNRWGEPPLFRVGRRPEKTAPRGA